MMISYYLFFVVSAVLTLTWTVVPEPLSVDNRIMMLESSVGDELAWVGPVASIDYTILPENGERPNSTCSDLRQKVWIVVHLYEDYYTTYRARLTAVRLDNVLDRGGIQRGDDGRRMVCSESDTLDSLWHSISGWSSLLLG